MVLTAAPTAEGGEASVLPIGDFVTGLVVAVSWSCGLGFIYRVAVIII